MKQVITFGCGHTCKVEVDGRNRNFRAQQIYAMEHGLCPECTEKENAERAREAAAATVAFACQSIYDLAYRCVKKLLAAA